MTLSILNNFNLLIVGVTIAAIGILGFIIFYSNPKSVTNRSFLLFSLMTIVYGILNYLNYQVSSPLVILWLLRLVIFSAVWHAFSLFKLLYVFPQEKFDFPKEYKYYLVPIVVITSLFNLSPWVFSRIDILGTTGQVSKTQVEGGIILFILVILCLTIGGLYYLFKKTLHAKNLEKTQYRLILIGTIITFSLLITFNMILPAVFLNVRFIPLAPIFIFPFIAFTAYAIIRHHLLDIKIIATEFLIFFLSVAALFEILLSDSAGAALVRFLIFLLILTLGILLDRSVRREVQQREQLQFISNQLGQANEKLKALDLARAEFISIASHQLRTPPATVKWFLSSILSGDYGKLPKTVETALQKTERTNNHLISLIEDMLNVSRIERGKMEFLFEPTDVLDLAEKAFEQLEPMAEQKQLKFTFIKPKEKLPLANADKEKLRQVMNNLMDNAIKYTPSGFVEASLKKQNNQLIFEVKDSGKGINPKEKEQIFQKFSRGKESIKSSAGLGLGLYVAKIVIEQHKGKIWAQSQGEGKGSSFLFSIPIDTKKTANTSFDFAAG